MANKLIGTWKLTSSTITNEGQISSESEVGNEFQFDKCKTNQNGYCTGRITDYESKEITSFEYKIIEKGNKFSLREVNSNSEFILEIKKISSSEMTIISLSTNEFGGNLKFQKLY